MATLNEHPSSEAVLIQSPCRSRWSYNRQPREEFLSKQWLYCYRLRPFSYECSYFSRMCVYISVWSGHVYVCGVFVPFILCSLGPKWKPLVFQGVYMKIAVVLACICINYCLFSLCLYVIVLSSRCVFLVLLLLVRLLGKNNELCF